MRLQLFSARSAMLSTAATAGVALIAMNLPAAATSKAAVHRDNTGSYNDSVSGGAVLSGVNSDGSNPFNDYGIEGKVANDTGGVGLLGYGQQAKSYGAYGVTFGSNGIGVYGAGDGPVPASGATPSSSQQSTGVVGDSHSGDGVYGSTEFPNASDPKLSPVAGVVGVDSAAADTDNNGVLGMTTEGGFGVVGISSNSGDNSAVAGVGGYGTTGYGTLGISTQSFGVLGDSTSNYGVYGSSGSTDGIYGVGSSTAGTYGVGGVSSGAGNGVGGSTTSDAGYGIVGNNTATTNNHPGAGVLAESTATTALYAVTNSVTGYAADITNTSDDGSTVGALGIFSPQIGATIETTADSSVGLFITAKGSDAHAIIVANPAGPGSLPVFTVDNEGDVTFGGTLNGQAQLRNGMTAKTFTARQSAPSIEDTGTGEMVNGAGSIRLDPAVVVQMDRSSAYRVFVTPDGDTRGVYVASKTPAGFTVRENQGGRSTVAFDYRIVASIDGQSQTRMSISPNLKNARPLVAFHREPAFMAVARPASPSVVARNAKIARTAAETVLPSRLFHPTANRFVESRMR